MARTRPPSFDFYPDDFISGTQSMHPLARGMYITLLCYQWSYGTIPDPNNVRLMMQVTGAMPDEIGEHLPELLRKFEKQPNGSYVNVRLRNEYERKVAICQKRRECGAASNFGKANASANADANASANADANAQTKADANLEVGSRKKEVGSRTAGSKEDGAGKTRRRTGPEVSTVGEWELRSDLDTPEVRALLLEYEKMRRDFHKKPITDRKASSRFLKRFDDAEHLVYALELCLHERWQGLKPDYRPPAKTAVPKANSHPKTFTQLSVDNTLQAAAEWAADAQRT